MSLFKISDAEELRVLGERIETALKRRPLLTATSLQYRLCEVGKSRADPTAVRRAVDVLRRTRLTRSGPSTALRPWEVRPHLYASAELDISEARALADERGGELDRLASTDWAKCLDGFIRPLREALPGLISAAGGPGARSVVLADTRVIEGRSELFDLSSSGAAIRVWLTQEADSLMPTDPRLWELLIRCADDGVRPLVIARYIDPTTFVLFSALGVRGLQFYCMWGPEAEWEDLARASDHVGWFNIKDSGCTEEHRIFNQVPTACDYLAGTEWDLAAREAVRVANTVGLARPDAGTSARLLEWAGQVSLALPDRWNTTMAHRLVWETGAPMPRELQRRLLAREDQSEPAAQRRTVKRAPPESQEPSRPEGRRIGPETFVERIPIRGW